MRVKFTPAQRDPGKSRRDRRVEGFYGAQPLLWRPRTVSEWEFDFSQNSMDLKCVKKKKASKELPSQPNNLESKTHLAKKTLDKKPSILRMAEIICRKK